MIAYCSLQLPQCGGRPCHRTELQPQWSGSVRGRHRRRSKNMWTTRSKPRLDSVLRKVRCCTRLFQRAERTGHRCNASVSRRCGSAGARHCHIPRCTGPSRTTVERYSPGQANHLPGTLGMFPRYSSAPRTERGSCFHRGWWQLLRVGRAAEYHRRMQLYTPANRARN